MNGSKYNRDMQTYLYEIKDSTVSFDFSEGVIPIVASSVDVLDPSNYNNATIDVNGTEISTISLVRNRTDDDKEDNLSAHLDAIYGTTQNNLKFGIAFDSFERTEKRGDKNYDLSKSGAAQSFFDTFSEGRVPTPEEGTKLLSDLVPDFAQSLGGPEGSVTDHVSSSSIRLTTSSKDLLSTETTPISTSSDVTLSSGNTEVVTAIAGLSPHLLNLVLYYENDLFSIRGSYNWRDAFPTSTGLQGTLPDLRTRKDMGQYDMSVQIPIRGFDDLQLTLEGINLNNVKEYEFFGVPERNYRYTATGRQYFVGIRGTF